MIHKKYHYIHHGVYKCLEMKLAKELVINVEKLYALKYFQFTQF
jgi:hypothetical protein